MREIKFRGKGKDNIGEIETGDWLYGGIVFDNDRYWIDIPYYGNIIVDNNTLGQYTGLKDKNGVEIYEGDILEINEKGRKLLGTETKLYDKYQVVLEKDGCYMNMSNIQYKESIKNKEFLGRITYFLWITKEYATVVGNIYDNPELLEKNIREEEL